MACKLPFLSTKNTYFGRLFSKVFGSRSLLTCKMKIITVFTLNHAQKVKLQPARFRLHISLLQFPIQIVHEYLGPNCPSIAKVSHVRHSSHLFPLYRTERPDGTLDVACTVVEGIKSPGTEHSLLNMATCPTIFVCVNVVLVGKIGDQAPHHTFIGTLPP